jgi:8-oxo-dGTP pyrophosphatase MutT (NUDIX family)
MASREEIVLIKQFRHGVKDFTIEIPGGIVEDGDSPKESARRELLEETGYKARKIIPLGWVYPNPAIFSNRCFTFIAEDLVKMGDQLLDEKEDIEVMIRPIGDIPALIRDGYINHSLVLVAFYRFYMEYLPGIQRGLKID